MRNTTLRVLEAAGERAEREIAEREASIIVALRAWAQAEGQYWAATADQSWHGPLTNLAKGAHCRAVLAQDAQVARFARLRDLVGSPDEAMAVVRAFDGGGIAAAAPEIRRIAAAVWVSALSR